MAVERTSRMELKEKGEEPRGGEGGMAGKQNEC